jgi:hypothetical protein
MLNVYVNNVGPILAVMLGPFFCSRLVVVELNSLELALI